MSDIDRTRGIRWALPFAMLGAVLGFYLAGQHAPAAAFPPTPLPRLAGCRDRLPAPPPEAAAPKPVEKSTAVRAKPVVKPAPVRRPLQDNPFDYNYALADHGATVTGGKRPEALIDGNTTSSYAYTVCDPTNFRTFTVTLAKTVPLNTVSFLLYGKSKRSYRYILEASSEDTGNEWFVLADRSKPPAKYNGWQKITFKPRAVARLRLTGTYCSSSSYFYVVELEAYHAPDGIEEPTAYNYALAEHGALATGGKRAERLIDGRTSSYAYTVWKSSTSRAFIVTLREPVPINVVRFLLCDRTPRYYRYKLEASAENSGENWIMLADRSQPPIECRGWQVVAFKSRVIARLRLTGTYCSSGSSFHAIELEAYHVPGGLDYPWLEWEF